VASPDPELTVVAFPDLNPLDWLGGAAVGVAAEGWKAMMVGLWSAGLWLLQFSFTVIDAFTTPDVSASGPLGGALPTTMWLGLIIAVIVMNLQLAAAVIRSDGQGLGRVLIGLVQFGAVWLSYLTVAGVLILAVAGLTEGILNTMLDVGSWSEFSVGKSWPRSVTDATTATVLGICSLLLLIPAAFAYLIVMLVREGALIILLATAPISAAGLFNDTTKVWFYKSLRWFFASLAIAPMAALILGIGVQISRGVVDGAGSDVAAVGTAVVGCVLVLMGAVCPMVLFKLLAFVEPGTSSGAALRQSVHDAGGMSGLLGGGKSAGSSAATAQSSDGGSSQGEAAAEGQASSRLTSKLGSLGAGIGASAKLASRAGEVASDVLGSAGIGDPGSAGSTRSRTRHNSSSGGRPWDRQGEDVDQATGAPPFADQTETGGGELAPAAPTTDPAGPVSPGADGGGPVPGGGLGPATGGGAAGGAAAGGAGPGGVGVEAAAVAL